MDMDGHLKLIFVVDFNIMGDHILNMVLEAFYEDLGVDGTFQAWWFGHLLMFLQVHILCPAVIIYSARQNLPEFTGLKANMYPGQEKPRTWMILPQRDQRNNIAIVAMGPSVPYKVDDETEENTSNPKKEDEAVDLRITKKNTQKRKGKERVNVVNKVHRNVSQDIKEKQSIGGNWRLVRGHSDVFTVVEID